jgi:hypothetical protein
LKYRVTLFIESEVSPKAVTSSRINGAWNKELVWEHVNDIDSGSIGHVMIVPIHCKDGMPLISVGKEFTPAKSDNDTNFASRMVIWKDKTGKFSIGHMM